DLTGTLPAGTQTLTAVGGGTAFTINGVTAGTDILTTALPHGFVTGQLVTYSATSPIGGLVSGQIYQVQAITGSTTTLKLFAIVDLATSTGTATNTNTLTGTGAPISISAIDTVNDII